MLGRDLVELLRRGGAEVTAAGHAELDIADGDAADAAVRGHDVVVNCAAWTAVDDAESHEPAAFQVNAVGAARLGGAAHAHGARMVQISTDYVFDGAATSPYAEDAPPGPRSAYGRTKLAGEWAVRCLCPDALVVRTGWLYGARGSCFPRTIARVAREQGGVEVVDDQVGQPTWTTDLADLVVRLVGAGAPAGTYHGTAGGQASWFEFARAVVADAGLDPAIVRPTSSEAFSRPAPCPAFSVLGHDRLSDVGVAPIGHWSQRWTEAAGVVLA